MSLLKTLLHQALIGAIAMIFLVAAAQFCAFALLADDSKILANADLIVAFPGGREREVTAWTLADQGLAPHLVIINSTANRLKTKAEKYENIEEVRLLEGGKSRSTFEDVYVAAEVIREYDFKSIILVTSSYHMPRSLFLFKMHLIGLGMKVNVQYFPVIAGDKKSLSVTLGIYYNELIKMWGSLVEIAGNHLTRELMYDTPQFQEASRLAHKYLLYGSK